MAIVVIFKLVYCQYSITIYPNPNSKIHQQFWRLISSCFKAWVTFNKKKQDRADLNSFCQIFILLRLQTLFQLLVVENNSNKWLELKRCSSIIISNTIFLPIIFIWLSIKLGEWNGKFCNNLIIVKMLFSTNEINGNERTLAIILL